MARARTIAETELDILRIRAMRVKMIGSAAKSASDPSLTEEPVPEAHAVAAFPASPMQSEDAQHALLGHCPTRSAGALQAQGAVASTASYQANVQVKHVISPKLYVYCILITTTTTAQPATRRRFGDLPAPSLRYKR